MSRFSILIINNHLTVTAAITQAVGQHLDDYRLTILQDIAETVDQTETADLILLDLSQLSDNLSDNITDRLASVRAVYPETSLILLRQVSAEDVWHEDKVLLAALAAGADDYVSLNRAGLLTLGRRIARLQNEWQQHHTEEFPDLPLGEPLDRALASNTSPLAVQVIGPDDRVRTWNRTAEILFGVKREQVRGRRVENLPLSPENLSRLKDILDQARITGEPFSISNYPFEDPHRETRWIRAHVYPLRQNPLTSVAEVCIISTDLTDLKQAEIQTWRYNQELQILLETSHESSKHLDLQRTLEQFIDQTKTLLNADNCCVYFLEKDNKTLRPALATGPMSEQIRTSPLMLGQGVIGAGAAGGKTVMLNAAGEAGKMANNSQIETPYSDKQHLLYAPLTALNGMIGVMVVNRHRAAFEEEDVRFFENLVQQGSTAINNARLFEETHRNLNELAILYEASAAISTIWNTQTVLNTLIEQMVYALNMSSGYIAGWDKARNTGIIRATFAINKTSAQENELELGSTFDLEQRPTLLTAISQQRPTVFQLSNPLLNQTERQNMEQHGCRSLLLMPLVAKGDTIGWTELWETREERIFTADEVRLARALANQVAVALENARYVKQTQQTLEETTALYQVASALTSTQDSHTIMSTVLREYLNVLNLKQGSVLIFDFENRCSVVKAYIQDRQIPTSTKKKGKTGSLEGRQIPLAKNPIYERLMRTHRPVKIEDTQAAWLTRDPDSPDSIGGGWAGAGALSMVVIPIQIREEIVGALIAEDTRHKRIFDEREISLGQTMADQLGVALQNAQLYELEFKRRQQAETLREVSFAVNTSLNLNEVLTRIMDQLGRVVKYDRAAIQLIEGNSRRIIAQRGFPQPEQVIGLTFPTKLNPDQPETVVFDTHEPLVLGQAAEAYDTFRKPPFDYIQSWMGIPLVARDKVIGLISIGQAETNAYQEEDVQLAMAFANQVAVAVENARLYELEVRELESELEIAHGIQETLLPQFVPQVAGLQISGRSLPARQIGGDFFHFFAVGEDQLGVAIGDVSGKGIPAALYMAAAITAIDTKINDGLAPAELLNHLNYTLYNRLQENKMNIGLQIATFIPLAPPNGANTEEARGSLMTVSSGGMIAPIGATVHGCRYLPVSGFPIGSFSPEQSYHEDMFLLDPFTTIIFTSDGIVEAQNKNGELFGFDRLEHTINEIISVRDAETIAEHIIQKATDFIAEAEQGDDMTVVVVVKT
ncbi:MAG: GAF domain-containing protein [Anaerolineae bacterium]|nr:GAF domain-containing protein [Anaerolineae bacterium]